MSELLKEFDEPKEQKTVPAIVPRTQKAAGVIALRNNYYITPDHILLQDIAIPEAYEAWLSHMLKAKVPLFARPCPKRPRHGFLESRQVDSREHIEHIIQETLAIDPDGEVLVMKEIEAHDSAILTPSQITIGPGHDGATGGKPGSFVFPLTQVGPVLHDIGSARIEGTPYIETVRHHSGLVYFVQLRDGPAAPPARTRWIPRDFTARNILVPTEDMLLWEKTVESQANNPGTVAFIPGGSMICHAAVHCVLNKVPVFLDTRPSEGEFFRANTEEEIPLRYDDIVEGVNKGLSMPLSRQDLAPAIMVAHQALGMGTNPIGARAVGTALAMVSRFGLACCLGELRHSPKGQAFLQEDSFNIGSREQVYETALTGYADTRKMFKGAFDIYLDGSQWNLIKASFGGTNWARCTLGAYEVDRAVAAMQIDPQKNFAEALAKAHNLINLCHNGGPLFTKVVSHATFEEAMAGTPRFVVESAYKMKDRLESQGSQFSILPPLPFILDVKTIEDKVAKFKVKQEQAKKSGYLFQQVKIAKKIGWTGIQCRLLGRDPKGNMSYRWQVGDQATGKVNEQDFHFPIPAKVKFSKTKGKSMVGSGAVYQRVLKTSHKHLPLRIVEWVKASGLGHVLYNPAFPEKKGSK